MLLNTKKFVDRERIYWNELEALLDRLDRDAAARLDLQGIQRLQYLYERASSALVRLRPYATGSEEADWLEALVARAYSEIHSERKTPLRLAPRTWLLQTFPRTVRKHGRKLLYIILLMALGGALGGGALALDPEAKPVLIPGGFGHLMGDPSDRVAEEETDGGERIRGREAQFSGQLMTHNIRVSIFVLSLGMTFGIGTGILIFYNGVILGAVAADYLLAGEGVFLAGWLLPHGSVEIPAVLLAGQAGWLLGAALIGSTDRTPLKLRLRHALPDLCTLIAGCALLLVWAGLVEAFFSQFHEPILPYAVKIVFGTAQLLGLTAYLLLAGREPRGDHGR